MTVVIGHERSSLNADKRRQCDCAFDDSKQRAVESTAVSMDRCFELAADATECSNDAAELRAGNETSASCDTFIVKTEATAVESKYAKTHYRPITYDFRDSVVSKWRGKGGKSWLGHPLTQICAQQSKSGTP